ncbi:MAG: hypothetical protein HOH43_14925 [Candidatus Latescibacteria bacterium]|jgi:hypothetical protein|nr:hypothetical protein [Candidatus Latescibacterota bacterium]
MPSAAAAPDNKSDLVWHNVEDWGVEGKGWSDTERYYDRFPGRARGSVRDPVWDLSRHSAGMCVRFETDAESIHVRYKLLNERLAMAHMPASGVSGLDLYAENSDGVDRWVSVVAPESQTIDQAIAQNLADGSRRYTIYLPLYNGVETLEIGVSRDALFSSESPRTEPPMVFYGTSITHGACASRPGMAFPAIIGRRLRRPTINLGFSGNGQMETEIVELLTELEASVYVIDCLPNMTPDLVKERSEPLVRQIRGAHPDTPILLVEDRTFTNAPFIRSQMEVHTERRSGLRTAYEELQAEGLTGLYYLAGDDILGSDGEGATDGSHPNDLGMMRYADGYEPVLCEIAV